MTQDADKIQQRGNQAGAALLAVIIGILIVATIGTAIISATMSSTSLQLGAVDSVSGYFLAESGMHYALTYLQPEMDAGLDPDTPVIGSMALLNNKTFTLPANGGQFHLVLSHIGCPVDLSHNEYPDTACTYTLVVTGIPNAKTKRTVTYTITPSG